MANKKKGKKAEWEEDDEGFAPTPQLKQNEAEETLDGDDDDQDIDFSSIADSVTPRNVESDAREIDSLTDRIFASVLSRYGWERHGNRIEHVGEERPRSRR
jgi:hypothetical protein